eukprot:TRINITY_DN13914_c0_g1_i1.p1 TRINITY_DN13914_c0_g1~~TRINITY_DN13914_c0_g1_i1.p1  ORF type:complete len:250 (-),score=37.24 TRINITY_DN13914_c0_g1_i1:77-826(-)
MASDVGSKNSSKIPERITKIKIFYPESTFMAAIPPFEILPASLPAPCSPFHIQRMATEGVSKAISRTTYLATRYMTPNGPYFKKLSHVWPSDSELRFLECSKDGIEGVCIHIFVLRHTGSADSSIGSIPERVAAVSVSENALQRAQLRPLRIYEFPPIDYNCVAVPHPFDEEDTELYGTAFDPKIRAIVRENSGVESMNRVELGELDEDEDEIAQPPQAVLCPSETHDAPIPEATQENLDLVSSWLNDS